MDKNLHLKNIDGHKKLNAKEVEAIHGFWRGMKFEADSLVAFLRSEEFFPSMTVLSITDPQLLPIELASVEWKLSEIVRNAADLLKSAAQAMEKCHALRGGNETLIRLIKEREIALKEK